MTQLPVLADRHPRDTHDDHRGTHDDRDTRYPRDTEGPRTGNRRAPTRHGHEQRLCRLAAEQTARAIRAHRPRALRVLVNGFQIGSHDLTAKVTRATHALAGPEPPRVIEVYSEQRVCLATLQVETVPDAVVSQQIAIALDDDRRLELSVVFDAQWPTLHLVFVQPLEESPAEHWIEDAAPAAVIMSAEARPSERWSDKESVDRTFDDGCREPSERSPLRWALRLWPRPLPWAPRPVLVGFAVLVFVIAMVGPSRAWSAVADAGRTVAKWVRAVVSDTPAPRSGTESRSTGGAARRGDIELPAPAAFASPASTLGTARPLRGLSESALLGLEVDVLERLDRAGALYGEDITLTRPRSGYLRLEGLVDSPGRRRALVDALGALASIPQFDVRLRAVPDPELIPRTAATTPIETNTRVFEVERDQSPVSDLLTAALMKQGVAAGPAVDQMARALAVRVMTASHDALRHTWAFKRMARHVDGERLQAVDQEAHRRWRALLSGHVTAFANDSARIQAELTAIGLLADAGTPEPDASRDAELAAQLTQLDAPLDAEQFVRLAEQQDRSVRALFASAPAAGVEVDAHHTLRDLAAQLRRSAIAAQRLLDR